MSQDGWMSGQLNISSQLLAQRPRWVCQGSAADLKEYIIKNIFLQACHATSLSAQKRQDKDEPEYFTELSTIEEMKSTRCYTASSDGEKLLETTGGTHTLVLPPDCS